MRTTIIISTTVLALTLAGCLNETPTTPESLAVPTFRDATPSNAIGVRVMGCDQVLPPHSIGVRSLRGSRGLATVAISINTDVDISAWTFDFQFPTGLLQYAGVARTDLTENSAFFGAQVQSDRTILRVSGVALPEYRIRAGAVGDIAIVSFRIIDHGVGKFTATNAIDDLETFAFCE